MSLQQLTDAQVSPEVPINENFETLETVAVYGKRHPATSGLTWGYYGGRFGGASIADGTLTLTNAADNYVVVAIATGVISTSTSTTNWNNTAAYLRVYKITTAGNVVTAVEDHRAGRYGLFGSGVADFDPASPGPIGGTTPGTGAFTTLSATDAISTTSTTASSSTTTGALRSGGGLGVAGAAYIGSNLTVLGATTTLGNGSAAVSTVLNGSASQVRGLNYHTAGVLRWSAQANSTAEGGSNAGSDYQINAYSDAGTLLGAYLSITRSNGAVAVSKALNEAVGTAVASAATTNLTTATGNTIQITGTTTITAITLGNGMRRHVLFAASLILTHGANLQLPGAANIQTRAGDRAIFIAEGGVTYCWLYQRADGSPVLTGTDPDDVVQHRDLANMAYVTQTWIDGTKTAYDPASIADGAQETTTVTIPGLVLGDFVVSVSLSIDSAGVVVTGSVTAADTVTLIYANTSGSAVDLASHDAYVRCMKRFPE